MLRERHEWSSDLVANRPVAAPYRFGSNTLPATLIRTRGSAF